MGKKPPLLPNQYGVEGYGPPASERIETASLNPAVWAGTRQWGVKASYQPTAGYATTVSVSFDSFAGGYIVRRNFAPMRRGSLKGGDRIE